MAKMGWWALWISIAFALVLIVGLFFYFSLSGPNYDNYYKSMTERGILANPAESMSIEDATSAFNESFVYYLLYAMRVYNLHNAPLSSEQPRIQIYVGDRVYYALVDSGNIIVEKGQITNEDVIVRTTAIDAVKMMNDKNYILGSFNNGGSAWS